MKNANWIVALLVGGAIGFVAGQAVNNKTPAAAPQTAQRLTSPRPSSRRRYTESQCPQMSRFASVTEDGIAAMRSY